MTPEGAAKSKKHQLAAKSHMSSRLTCSNCICVESLLGYLYLSFSFFSPLIYFDLGESAAFQLPPTSQPTTLFHLNCSSPKKDSKHPQLSNTLSFTSNIQTFHNFHNFHSIRVFTALVLCQSSPSIAFRQTRQTSKGNTEMPQQQLRGHRPISTYPFASGESLVGFFVQRWRLIGGNKLFSMRFFLLDFCGIFWLKKARFRTKKYICKGLKMDHLRLGVKIYKKQLKPPDRLGFHELDTD